MFNIFKRNNKDVKLFYHTDVHCHILPGVDHGAKNIQDGIELLKADMDMGIKRVILTPHVTSETFENTPETLNAAFAIFKEAVKEAGLDVELHLSAEYRIDDYWQKEYAAGHVIPMPGHYVLLENSFAQELIGSEQMMFELRCSPRALLLLRTQSRTLRENAPHQREVPTQHPFTHRLLRSFGARYSQMAREARTCRYDWFRHSPPRTRRNH